VIDGLEERLGLRWMVLSEGQLNNANYAGRPTVCRNCGALVGSTETVCSLCGAPKTAVPDTPAQASPTLPQHAHDGEAIRFARAILTRPYIFTIIFIAANIFIFLLMWSSSGLDSTTLWEPPPQVLYAYGAKLNYLIQEKHEWWRFVTPVFIHIGVIHLLVNMYGLWMIGPYVERLYGSAKFVALWVGTGIMGVAASYLSVRPGMAAGGPIGRFLFRTVDGPSAGASGALFGLIGVLFVFGIKFRRELPEGFKRAFGTGLLPVILINLYIGYIGRGFIDNSAHLGGLFSGALFALVIGYQRPGERPRFTALWQILQGVALVLIIVSFAQIARHFKDYNSPSNHAAVPGMATNSDASKAISYANALAAGETAFVNAYNDGNMSELEPALAQLESSPRLDEKAEGLRDELKSLLTRIKEFIGTSAAGRKPPRAREEEKRKLFDGFVAWQKKYLEWMKNDAVKYGIRLQTPDTSAPDLPETK
jgi:membrane associated rhomboid family serine protease